MKCLQVSGAVRRFFKSLGFKGLNTLSLRKFQIASTYSKSTGTPIYVPEGPSKYRVRGHKNTRIMNWISSRNMDIIS